MAGWGWWRWKQARNRVYDPLLIKEKVGRIAFDAELQVIAVLPDSAGEQRSREILEPVAAAYRHYDHPAGARFKVSAASSPWSPSINLHPAGAGAARQAQRPGGEGSRRPVAPARRGGRDSVGGTLRLQGAPALGPGGEGRRARGPDHGREFQGDTVSPRTCCAATTSTWPAPAWANPP